VGLAIDVGAVAYLLVEDEEGAKWVIEDIEKLNKILVENKLPKHIEPTKLPKLDKRGGLESFPYSYLHYLRRYFARFLEDSNWQPTPMSELENSQDEEITDKWTGMNKYHLLSHSDCEGYYLPVDFKEIFFSEDTEVIPGNYLCSTYKLKEELATLAPLLKIRLEDGVLGDEEIERLEALPESHPYSIETMVWLTLFEATRLSLEHKTAICFC